MPVYRENALHAWTKESIRLAAAPSPFAKETLLYIQEIGHFHALENYFTEREQLDSFLVVYTLAGSGRLRYRDETYILAPNQLFFIHCMEYQHYSTEGTGWELLWVHLNGPAALGYYEQYDKVTGKPVVALPLESTISAILRQLVQINLHKSWKSELLSSQLLVELLTDILISSQQADIQGTETPVYIEAIMREFDHCFHEKISLDSLALKYAVSKYHLAKQFKRHTGYSPHDYLINVRIAHAIELLKYTSCTVADIAMQVGIDNVSHFINLFKDRTDSTPLAYRKQWQMPK